MTLVNLELTLLPQSTLLVTVEASFLQTGTYSSSHQLAAQSARINELNDILRDDIVGGLVVVIRGDLSGDTLRKVASWFPRRLNGGRIAVVCESELKGRAFASTLTVPLLPRPVRVFPVSCLADAITWAAQDGFIPTLPLAGRPRPVWVSMTKDESTSNQTLRIPDTKLSWHPVLNNLRLATGVETN